MKQELSEYAQNLLDRQSFVEDGLKEWEAVISKAERSACGLTLDAAKTPEWKEAKRQYSIYWDAYRRINQQLSKIRKVSHYDIVDGKRIPVYQYTN